MPVEFRIDPSDSLVRIKPSNPLDDKQIVEMVHRLLSEPGFRAGLNIISDNSELKFSASKEVVSSIPGLLSRLADRLGPFRCALVVPTDVSFGMARVTEAYAENSRAQIRGFRTLEEAEAWVAEVPDDERLQRTGDTTA